MVTIETERLILRGWRDDDLDGLAALNADPEVMRYIRDGAVRDRAWTEQWLGRAVTSWADNGFGLFATEVRDTGVLIGWAGLAVPAFLPEVLPAVEIGWRLHRSAWGHGFATEAARAALRFGFLDRDLDRIISIRHVDNDRSRRVMEKLGIAYEFGTVTPDDSRPVAVHALTRSRYDALTAR